MQPAVSKLIANVDEIHVHIDPDVFDAEEAPANSYQFLAKGGMSVEQLRESIALIKTERKITSATIASYDPEYDPQARTLNALFKLVNQVLSL
jgi:arginase family enzyme